MARAARRASLRTGTTTKVPAVPAVLALAQWLCAGTTTKVPAVPAVSVLHSSCAQARGQKCQKCQCQLFSVSPVVPTVQLSGELVNNCSERHGAARFSPWLKLKPGRTCPSGRTEPGATVENCCVDCAADPILPDCPILCSSMSLADPARPGKMTQQLHQTASIQPLPAGNPECAHC